MANFVHSLDITDNVVGYEQYVNVVHSLDITASGGGYEQSVNVIHSLDITAAGCGYELNVNGRAHRHLLKREAARGAAPAQTATAPKTGRQRAGYGSRFSVRAAPGTPCRPHSSGSGCSFCAFADPRGICLRPSAGFGVPARLIPPAFRRTVTPPPTDNRKQKRDPRSVPGIVCFIQSSYEISLFLRLATVSPCGHKPRRLRR